MKITGKFLEFNKINKNGRIYTKKCAEDIVKQFGELDHPMFGEFGCQFDNVVHLSTISHVIKEIHINKKEHCIEGTLEVLNTNNGKTLKTIIDSVGGLDEFNQHFFIVSRGMGNINKKNKVENYKIISFDVTRYLTDKIFKLE